MRHIIYSKFIFTLCVSLLLLLTLTAQNDGDHIFNSDILHEVRIELLIEGDWQLMKNNFESNFGGTVPYIMAHVTIDSTQIDSIGLRFKGFTSYPWDSDKKPFKLDFNEYVKGKRYDGLRKLNLNNGTGDPSMQRDVICYDLMRNSGAKASRTSYSRVYVNDVYWGLYQNIEQVDKEYLQRNFVDNDGNLWKNKGWNYFEYHGTDPGSYGPPYELKTNEEENDWTGLIMLMDIINNTSNEEFKAAMDTFFDIEQFVEVLAVDVATNNWDSHLQHGRNWYMYQDSTHGKFHWIPWDYNFALGSPFFGGEENFSIDQTENEGALINRILSIPEYRTMYYDEFCNLLQTSMKRERLDEIIEKNRMQIDTAILDDPNFLSDYTSFISDISDTLSPESFIYKLHNRIEQLNAEIEQHVSCKTAISIDYQSVTINEFMASNDEESGISDSAGEYDDWIELYNNTLDTIDLSGLSMSDDREELNKWSIPDGIKIADGEYLIIWADNDEEQEGLHAGFKLGASGEEIFFTNADGSVIDSITFPEQTTNISYARRPNGTGDFVFQDPTFGENNLLISSIEETSSIGFATIYPNPAQHILNVHVESKSHDMLQMSIVDLTGRVLSQQETDQALTQINVSWLPAGFYTLRLQNNSGEQAIQKFSVVR